MHINMHLLNRSLANLRGCAARSARICFFAEHDIEPMTELMYDYGYQHGDVQPEWTGVSPF